MKPKYDHSDINYNQTRAADPFIVGKLWDWLTPSSNGIYLDIGCGTGNYTNALQQKGASFIGMDPSEKMISKAKQQNNQIDWRKGKAEKIPLAHNSMDGVVASLTMHHWLSLEEGFKVLGRVLKPDAKLVIFTSTPQQMEGYWLNHYFPKMLEDSIQQMPALYAVEKEMKNGGIELVKTEPYFVQPDLKDHFLYCGKDRPELYLNPSIRNGISSFSFLANREEVMTGIAQLEKDIRSGKISQIIESFHNEAGDYLFMVGKKR